MGRLQLNIFHFDPVSKTSPSRHAHLDPPQHTTTTIFTQLLFFPVAFTIIYPRLRSDVVSTPTICGQVAGDKPGPSWVAQTIGPEDGNLLAFKALSGFHLWRLFGVDETTYLYIYIYIDICIHQNLFIYPSVYLSIDLWPKSVTLHWNWRMTVSRLSMAISGEEHGEQWKGDMRGICVYIYYIIYIYIHVYTYIYTGNTWNHHIWAYFNTLLKLARQEL